MTETAADEQDLAKALDSVASAASSLDGSTPASNSSDDDSNHDDTTDNGIPNLPPIVPPDSPIAPLPQVPAFPPITPAHDSNDTTPSPVPHPPIMPAPALDDTQIPDTTSDDTATTDASVTPVEEGPLADIKKDALDELRPLVDKLNVSAEEKFDTYLLLIRSTDDQNLIAPAHEAAKAIEDEARKAEALLEIIKEIDYLSRQSGSKES